MSHVEQRGGDETVHKTEYCAPKHASSRVSREPREGGFEGEKVESHDLWVCHGVAPEQANHIENNHGASNKGGMIGE